MAEHGRAPRGSPGWAPAVGRRIAKNAAANAFFSPRKRPKTMQNDLRSSFLAPFRADRATAASDIIHHVADDDLRRVRQQRLVRCRSMCGPFLARTPVSGKNRAVGREIWQGPSQPPRRARAGVGRGNRRARSGPMPRQATFPAWPFLGPAASFAAGSSARRLVERNGAANDERPRLPLPTRAADRS